MNRSDNAYALLEIMMNKGMPFAGFRIEQIIGQPIQIADSLGQVHYPVLSNDTLPFDKSLLEIPLEKLYIDIPVIPEGQEYYYNASNQQFYYCLGSGDTGCYFYIEDLQKDSIPSTITAISDSGLALKWYFTSFAKISKVNRLFERELMEYFFFKGDNTTKDIFKLNNVDYDPEKPCYIQIVDIDKSSLSKKDQKINMQSIRPYIVQYCKREAAESLPVVWHNRILLMTPYVHKEDSLELDEEWPNFGASAALKKQLDERFNITTTIGIGRVQKLKDIQKSFVEACIVLSVLDFLGKKGVIQKFADLGFLTLIFPQDINCLREYIKNTLAGLINFDKKNNGELMTTLETLVRSRFNRKIAADLLFIHPNTLHYRLSRIEQIIKFDLSDIYDCLQVFAVTIVYNTFRENNWIKL